MAKLTPHDPLAPVRKSPARVTTFVLNPAALRNQGLDCPPVDAFPREVLACKNLRRLELFRGIAPRGDQTIPPEIGQLRNLRELSLGGLGFTALPDELGQLTKLKKLDLVYCEALRRLPATLGKLVVLEELSLGDTGLRELPRAIGKLAKLKRLSVSGIKTVPAELWRLRRLEELALPTSVTELPRGLGKLSQLTELSISARALASAARELPELTRLKRLWITGRATALPDELGALRALTQLSAGYLGLEALPASLRELTRLEDLAVDGNALTELVPLVLALPRLKALAFSGNPLAPGDKRRLDAIMRLPPSRRTTAPAPRKAAPAAERLGQVTSINASLIMLVADARLAAQFHGIDNASDPDGNARDSDCDRLYAALAGRNAGPFALAGGKALALRLGVGAGQASIWSAADRLVLFEGSFHCDEDELAGEDAALFHELIASPPRKARKLGTVAVPSGQLVVSPSTDSCTDVAKLVMRRRPRTPRALPCGDDRSGRMITVEPGTYACLLEDTVHASWGSGRRCHLIRTT